MKYNFIITSDSTTASLLSDLGYKEISNNNNIHTFINDQNLKFDNTINTKKIKFSNMIYM